jgi:hypothetical protein
MWLLVQASLHHISGFFTVWSSCLAASGLGLLVLLLRFVYAPWRGQSRRNGVVSRTCMSVALLEVSVHPESPAFNHLDTGFCGLPLSSSKRWDGSKSQVATAGFSVGRLNCCWFRQHSIPGFSLLEIRDQDFYSLLYMNVFRNGASSSMKEGSSRRCVCCTVVSARVYPHCHGLQVTMGPVHPLLLHFTK